MTLIETFEVIPCKPKGESWGTPGNTKKSGRFQGCREKSNYSSQTHYSCVPLATGLLDSSHMHASECPMTNQMKIIRVFRVFISFLIKVGVVCLIIHKLS